MNSPRKIKIGEFELVAKLDYIFLTKSDGLDNIGNKIELGFFKNSLLCFENYKVEYFTSFRIGEAFVKMDSKANSEFIEVRIEIEGMETQSSKIFYSELEKFAFGDFKNNGPEPVVG